MGLLDRLLGNRSEGSFSSKPAKDKASPAKKEDTIYLDPDTSSSLGDTTFMRRSNTIRHTFPGNLDNPGDKEMVQEVASMNARLERATAGLPSVAAPEATPSLTGGVPKPVKKTFVEKMSAAELGQRLRGAAVSGVNAPGSPAGSRTAPSGAEGQPKLGQQPAKPGAIDAFKDMARDLNT